MKRWIRSLFPSRHDGPLVVDRPRIVSINGVQRVSLRIDGQELWFESSDATLVASAEAFATALLVPSLRLGRPLEIRSPVCPRWLHNQRQAARLVTSWWNYAQLDSPQLAPTLGPGVIDHDIDHSDARDRDSSTPSHSTPSKSPESAQPPKQTALCFTGGVDSFYTLLHAQPQADLFVFALGYDVDLRDRALARAAERTIRSVASEVGKQALVVASNLRRHRTFRVESWERTHGSALGAIGHLLTNHASLLQISASNPYGSSTFWGSRWDLDPLFASSQLAIQHFGAEYLRTQKLWQIAHEPIVRRHLRVCWVRHRGEGNCGRCEKCVRTMLVLETCGQLEHYPTLGRRDELADRIDAVPTIPWGTVVAYNVLTQRDMRPDVRRAVERLLERTHAASGSTDQRRSAAA